jgi:hypothetical protein
MVFLPSPKHRRSLVFAVVALAVATMIAHVSGEGTREHWGLYGGADTVSGLDGEVVPAMKEDTIFRAAVPPKNRALKMMMCKKKGKKCQATKKPTKKPTKFPTNKPTPRPTAECSAGDSSCTQGTAFFCRSTCLCSRDVEGGMHCIDPRLSPSGCEAICATSADCDVGERCIADEPTLCCSFGSCIPLCAL